MSFFEVAEHFSLGDTEQKRFPDATTPAQYNRRSTFERFHDLTLVVCLYEVAKDFFSPDVFCSEKQVTWHL
ncbi:MAG: hypothetical protein ACREP9_08020 [Candidatus Dormibacteraceae bacterium]